MKENSANLVDGKYGITDLVNLERLRDIFEKFTRATGFTIGFLDHPGMNILAATGWRDICTKFHRGCQASADICTKSNRHLLDALNEPGQMIIEPCENGLVDCAIPIIIKGKHIASLATGQLLLEPPDIERFRRQSKMYGYNEQEYLAALSQIPVVSKETLLNITLFLGDIASTISEMGYTNLLIKEKSKEQQKDITERKQAEEAMKKSVALLFATLEASQDGILSVDSDGRIINFNQRFLDLWRIPSELAAVSDDQQLLQFVMKQLRNPQTFIDDVQNFYRNPKEVGMDILDFEDGRIFQRWTSPQTVEGNVVGRVWIFHDITEQRKAEEMLRESENRLQRFSEITQEGIVFHDKGIITDANPALLKIFGYSDVSEIIGTKLTDHVIDESKELIINNMLAGSIQPFQVTAIRNDGSYFPLEASPGNYIVKGQKVRFAGVHDISERKKAEKELRESEERYAALFKSAIEGILLADVETKKFVYANPSICKMLGYSEDEMKCLSVMDIHPEESLEEVLNEFEAQAHGKKALAAGLPCKRKDGSVIYANISASSVILNQRNYNIGFFTDVTESKRAENALWESEEWNRVILHTVLAGVIVIDADSRIIIQANDEALKLIGLAKEQVIGNVCHKFICPAEKKNCPILDHGKAVDLSEKILLTANGERKNIIKTVVPIQFRDRRYLIESFVDITERKQAEEALKKSEEKFRVLTEKSPVGIYIMQDGMITYANPSALKMFGYTSEEVIGIFSIKDLIHPDEVPFLMKKLQERLEGKTDISNPNYKAIKKDGSIIYVEIFGLMIDYQGKPAVMGTLINITERKQAEEALRESEKQVRRKLDAILSPEANISALELSDIIDSEKIQKLMDKFFQLTNIGMAIIDLHGNVLVGTGWQEICTKFHRINPETCSLCVESDLELSRDVPMGTFKLYRCKNNMWDMASPIKLGDTLLGNFFLGQFLFDDEIPDYETFRQQAQRYGFNEKEYIAALDRVPRWSHKTVDAVMSFYTSFAEMIGNLSYANVKLASTLEERKRAEEALRESEEKYRSVIESAPVGIFIIKDEVIQYVNPVMNEITGYTEQDVLGKHFLNFVAKKYREIEQQFYTRRMKGEIFPSSYETGAIIKNGREIPVELTVSVFNLFGEKAEMVFVRDITERKEAERILLQNKQELDSIYNTVGDMVFQLQFEEGDRFRFNSVNRTFENYTGLKASTVVGKLIDEIIPEPLLEITIKKYHKAIKQKTIVKWEGTMQFPTRALTCEFSVAPVFDVTGKCTHLVGSIHDITERKMIEERIKKLNEELEDSVQRRTKQLEVANNELEAFAHSVSHDLRAPLRGMDGFSQALLEDYQDKFDAQGKNYLHRIRLASQRMGKLIDDMLNLAHVSRSEMNMQQVDLSQMSREIATDHQDTQPERKVEFIIPDGIKAWGDRSLLHIVLENLIGNAWKFTSKHPTARIEFGRQKQKEKLVYFIRDDGAGFDMNYAQKLFGTFQRLHTTAEFPGTGVGLATVQRVIHRHGGEVWAEAEIEKGSIFYFTIPKKQYHDK